LCIPLSKLQPCKNIFTLKEYIYISKMASSIAHVHPNQPLNALIRGNHKSKSQP
jgi:hypothetical protein